ncbi:MAG: TolC family outer membrane protein [Pseudomonadales bacterium]|jgi:outer membrane protein|nr:TolC family outer membrane protein [Pseudomonadales bacterium]
MRVPVISRLQRAVGIALLGFGCGGVCSSALADDLLQIFNLAVQNDPTVRQARATYNASHTTVDQGRALLLPTINLTARASRDTSGLASPPPDDGGSVFQRPVHSFGNGYVTKTWGLSLRQALFNAEAWYSFNATRKNDEAAAVNLASAEQALIMRVATAYFNVLRSQTNLATFTAEEEAARRVLEQTQQRFDVGLVAITDVYDSRANADLASVNRLVEENNLNQNLEALEAITGQTHHNVDALAEDFPIVRSDTPIEDWTTAAMNNNLAIRAAQLTRDARQEDTKAAKSRFYPTADLNMSYSWSQSANPFTPTPGLANESSGVGVNLTVPIFAGGLNSARLRQAYYTRDASEEALLKSQRDSTQSVHNAFRSVETDVRAVAARAQAIVSAQSALDATQVGAEVGTRNVVDVVLAQRSLFQAKRDHANARYNYAIDNLTLKQAAGMLSPQDVIDLNAWLQGGATVVP